jgi:hypothetical protein
MIEPPQKWKFELVLKEAMKGNCPGFAVWPPTIRPSHSVNSAGRASEEFLISSITSWHPKTSTYFLQRQPKSAEQKLTET